jgi:hypothetical protein
MTLTTLIRITNRDRVRRSRVQVRKIPGKITLMWPTSISDMRLVSPPHRATSCPRHQIPEPPSHHLTSRFQEKSLTDIHDLSRFGRKGATRQVSLHVHTDRSQPRADTQWGVHGSSVTFVTPTGPRVCPNAWLFQPQLHAAFLCRPCLGSPTRTDINAYFSTDSVYEWY